MTPNYIGCVKMEFTEDFIDNLKNRISIVDIVGKRVKLIRRGGEYIGLCPFHSEKTPSFTLNEGKGLYYCFGCGAGGTSINFVMQTEGLSFRESIEKLATELGIDIPTVRGVDSQKQQIISGLYGILEIAAEWFEKQLSSSAGTSVRRYLEDRGIGGSEIKRFGLGYALDRPDALKAFLINSGFSEELAITSGLVAKPEGGGNTYDRFRNRLIFPISDKRGRVIAFGGRAVSPLQSAKYINSPETPLFSKGRLLYNNWLAREPAREFGSIVVVEGYMDVIALDKSGVQNVVAPLGTALTEEQLSELWRLAPEPILCFDGDDAGRRAADRVVERALPLLKPGYSLNFLELPFDEDPDSIIREQGGGIFLSMLNNDLRALWRLIWTQKTEGREFNTPERRAGLRADLLKRANLIGDKTVRDYYKKQFQEELDKFFSRSVNEITGRERNKYKLYPNRKQRLAIRDGLGRGAEVSTQRREALLVAGLLHHPDLIHEVFEDLEQLHLRSVDLDKIVRGIIKSASSGAPLDLETLKKEISETVVVDRIDELTRSGNVNLDPFVRPGIPLKELREGWMSVFKLHRLDDLRRELKSAQEHLGEEMNETNFQRLAAIKEAVAKAEAEAADLGEEL